MKTAAALQVIGWQHIASLSKVCHTFQSRPVLLLWLVSHVIPVSADFVCAGMWSAMTKGLTKEQKACLKAPLVYQEVMSYIKGSAEALEAGGHLSLEQYQDVSV